MIIIDLLDCDIIHNIDQDQDPDTISDDTDQQIIPHLTQKMGNCVSSRISTG